MKNKKETGIVSGDRETFFCKPIVDKSGEIKGVLRTSIANFSLKRIGVGRQAVFMEEDINDDIEYWRMEYLSHNHKEPYIINMPIKIFSDVKSFQQFVMKYDGSFTGTSAHLSAWVSRLEMKEEGDPKDIEFYIIDNLYGRWFIGDKDVWVFRNGFYMDGEFREMQGFLEYDNGKKGLVMEMKENKDMAPFFDKNVDIPESADEIEDIFLTLSEFFPNIPIVMVLITAFYASSLRYSDFFKALGIKRHPILQVSGKTSTGKTELFTSLLNKLVGLQDVDAGSWHSTSPFVNEKSLSLVSHFPLIRDEYRENGKENARKMELIRSAFNRVPVKKGTVELDLVGFPVRSTLILLGENAPSDPANRNRCISISMGTEDKVCTQRWIEIKDQSKDWFKFFLYVINKKIDAEQVKKDYNFFIENIKSADRTGENYAQLLTVHCALFVDANRENRQIILDALLDDTRKYIESFSDDERDDDGVAQFMNTFESAIARTGGKLKMGDYIKFTDKEVYLYISGMGDVMDSSQKERILNPRDVRNILKKEYMAETGENTRIGQFQITRSCVKIKITNCPQVINDFREKIEAEEDAGNSKNNIIY